MMAIRCTQLFFVGCLGCFKRNSRFVETNSSAFFNFQNESVTIEFSYIAMSTANGYHVITLFNFFNKFFLVLRFLLLWTDHEKVKDNNDPPKDDILKHWIGLLRLSL